jgi:hypothetical protein
LRQKCEKRKKIDSNENHEWISCLEDESAKNIGQPVEKENNGSRIEENTRWKPE